MDSTIVVKLTANTDTAQALHALKLSAKLTVVHSYTSTAVASERFQRAITHRQTMTLIANAQRLARVPTFKLSASNNHRWLNICGKNSDQHLGYCQPNADHPDNFDIAIVVYAESGANVGGDWIQDITKKQLKPTIHATLQSAFARRREMNHQPKRRRPAFGPDKRQELLTYYDDRDPPFHVIKNRKTADTMNHPLAILIHPGDLIPGPMTSDDKDERDALEFMLSCQRGTASDISDWRRAGADVVVLHRASCSQFGDCGGSRVAY